MSMSMTRLPSSLLTHAMMTSLPSFSLQLGMSEDQNKQMPLKRCEVLHFTCITSLTILSN